MPKHGKSGKKDYKIPDTFKVPEDLTSPRYPRNTGGLLPCRRYVTGGLATCNDESHPIPSDIFESFTLEDKDFFKELEKKLNKKSQV